MMYYNCTDDPNVKCRDFVEVRYYHNLANPGARYEVGLISRLVFTKFSSSVVQVY
jgi:hypothetical protein